MRNNFIVVLVTVANKQEAEKIAQTLLEAKLIACANVVERAASYFRWGGKIECTNEMLIIMKSRKDLFEELSGKVRGIHSSEVPEIIALPIVAGLREYLEWLDNSLK